MIDVKVVGDRVVASSLISTTKVVDQRVRKAVRFGGQMLRTRIMRNASGRPGPNAPTGDYRRSWGPGRVTSYGGQYSVEVGTNAPQGRRLEYGFHGVDSLGRHYDQRPYPHVGPAVEATAPTFANELEKAVRDL
jgi:hypothetical protein